MKEYLKYFIERIFNIFNYEIKIGENDLKLASKKKDVKGVEFNIEGDIFIMKFLRYSYTLNISVYYLPNSFLAMGRYCLNCFKRNAIIFENSKNADKYAVKDFINKTIETSIIVTLLKSEKPKKDSKAKNKAKYILDKNEMTSIIENLFTALNKWSYRTYEGRKVPFSININYREQNCIENLTKIVEFLDDDASALLTDGITSYFNVGKKLDYKIVELINIEDMNPKKLLPLVPYRFSSFANICDDNQIGIVLTIQGDIIVIQKRKILFAKRNGEWHSYDFEPFAQNINKALGFEKETNREGYKANIPLLREMFLSCLDVAFARTGGCLALCLNKEEVISFVNPEDLHRQFRPADVKTDLKREIIENTVIQDKPFNKVKRKARQEMLGIDGVTILDIKGDIITTGAIISNEIKIEKEIESNNAEISSIETSTETQREATNMSGGARTRVALKLSEYGIAIKISADGYIVCYNKNTKIY